MCTYTPYVYLIGWSHLDTYYIGCEYAEKSKIAHPANLWTLYYTSSDDVKSFAEKYGNPDIIQIRKTFRTGDDTVKYESRILQRLDAKNHPKLLNRHNGDGKFGNPLPAETIRKIAESLKGKTLSIETRRKMSEAHKGKICPKNARLKISDSLKGRPSPNKGKKTPEEIREKISNSLKGKAKSQDHRQNLSESRKGKPSPNKGKKASAETRKKLSEANRNMPRVTCPHCDKRGSISNMKRWHFENCPLYS